MQQSPLFWRQLAHFAERAAVNTMHHFRSDYSCWPVISARCTVGVRYRFTVWQSCKFTTCCLLARAWCQPPLERTDAAPLNILLKQPDLLDAHVLLCYADICQIYEYCLRIKAKMKNLCGNSLIELYNAQTILYSETSCDVDSGNILQS